MSENKKKLNVLFKSASFKRLSASIMVMLVLAYFVYNFVLSTKNQGEAIVTQTAVFQTIYKSVTADIFFAREETILSSGASGNVIPAVKNGTKVSGGDTVAYVLNSPQDVQLVARREVLEDEIDYYENIDSANASSLIADVDQDKKKITDSLSSVLENIVSGDLDSMYNNSRELRESITKMQLDTGNVIDVSAKLSSLRAEYDAINSSQEGRTALLTEKSGSFYSHVDGYETAADYADILNTDTEDIDRYINAAASPVATSAYGKIVTQFAWYAVCSVEQSDIPSLGVGSEVTVCFPYIAADDIVMKVAAINKGENGKTALVLRSTQMSDKIASLRMEKAVLRVENYSGYRVENSAIRFVDGEAGVYVLYGNIVDFKRINNVYQDENITLAYNTDNISNHLKLYDEIITEGTDLYDGKIID